MRLYFLTLALCLIAVSHAFADSLPKSLGVFEQWGAYDGNESGHQVCYVAAKPASSTADGKKRGSAFAQVSHRPTDHRDNVVNFLPGYSFKAGTTATLQIGAQNFTLFTHGNAAFAQDEDDPKIVALLRGADAMVFRGMSNHGTEIADTFSLKGFETAYESASKACGVGVSARPNATKPATTKKAAKAKP